MYNVVITEKGGAPRTMEFDKPEVTIGRVQGNDIILPKGNISKRHSRIVLKDSKFIIVDLKSTNGTYVNGRKITSPHILKDSDKIYIGDFTLTIEARATGAGAAVRAEAAPPPPPPPQPPAQPPPPRMPPPKPAPVAKRAPEPPPPEDDFEEFIAPEEDYAAADGGAEEFEEFAPEPEPEREAEPEPEPEPEPDLEPAFESPPTAPPPAPPPRAPIKKAAPHVPPPPKRSEPAPRPAAPPPRKPAAAVRQRPSVPRDLLAAQAQVFEAVVASGDLARYEGDAAGAEQAARRALTQAGISGAIDKDAVVANVAAELAGFGPLDPLLNDESISQVFANNPHSLFVNQNGQLAAHDGYFSSASSMTHVIRKLVASARVPAAEDAPIVEARLADGTHITALLPPVGAHGPVLTLRKLVRPTASLEKLVESGTLTQNMAEFLTSCVEFRKNIVVSTNSNADGTSLLRAVGERIGENERIVTVEEVAQLNLPQANVVALEAAPLANGRAIGLRDLVRMALRLAPDRLIVGDCRGGEALEVLQAMGGALDGSALMVHCHSPRDCISQIEAMMQMGGVDATSKALREAIAAAVNVIVQVTRYADGVARVSQIAVVTGMEVDLVTMQDIFQFRSEGADKDGNSLGRFLPTGVVPRFFEELQRRGEKVNMGIFRE